MKMLMVIYNDVADEHIVALFKKAHVQGYTKWQQVLGEGCETEPKLGTHCWPGKNNVLASAVEEDQASGLVASLKELKSRQPKLGIRTFVLQAEEAV
jgi:hypothetical protein